MNAKFHWHYMSVWSIEAIFYQSLEHKIGSRVSVHDACLKHMAKTITMQGLIPSAINHTFMIV